MKRLLRISFDLSLLSFVPIISWFLIGIIVDKNLINIFTLTYPLQFIYYIVKSIFSTGANISKEKDKNENAVMSGLFIGSILALVIFSFVLFNIEKYITFMNMDIGRYKIFAIYSVIQLFISLEFAMILDKLYYEEKNETANKYSIIFNFLNFSLLIGSALITKNQIAITAITLIPLIIFVIYAYVVNSTKFKLRLDIFKCIKYDSVELFKSIAFLLIFLFGLSNALEFGEKYAIALTFISLITDTQWDTMEAIVKVATIDISKKKFNYKNHIKNAYKLVILLIISSFIMFGILYRFYDLDIKITLIYLSIELVNLFVYPIYRIRTCYLQLEWSAFKMTTNKMINLVLRFVMSFLNTPFCTGIGQLFSSVYQLATVGYMFNKNYSIEENGKIKEKIK